MLSRPHGERERALPSSVSCLSLTPGFRAKDAVNRFTFRAASSFEFGRCSAPNHSERGLRNSSWQGARSTPVVGLGLELHTGGILTGGPRRDDRWCHHLSRPLQFCHGTGWEGNILQSPALVIQPTILSDPLSTFSARTRRLFGGIGDRSQTFRSGVQCSNH
ncbi:hypothetical protein TNCV_538111 [Trichonephila clavipes]|nr:hypothetical protein TNCV_538111 [Trichonephila clavipes]